jgi:hypothetical protein
MSMGSAIFWPFERLAPMNSAMETVMVGPRAIPPTGALKLDRRSCVQASTAPAAETGAEEVGGPAAPASSLSPRIHLPFPHVHSFKLSPFHTSLPTRSTRLTLST